MWFQWFRGSKEWPNSTMNTIFCVNFFSGLIEGNPPKNALYHTVQMVLFEPCDRLIFRFWLLNYDQGWSTMVRNQGWAGKAFWLPGTGREIENHIPALREGNGNLQIATGREGKENLRLVIPGNPGNHIKSKIKFKIIFMRWQAIRSQSFFNQCKDDICNRFTQL